MTLYQHKDEESLEGPAEHHGRQRGTSRAEEEAATEPPEEWTPYISDAERHELDHLAEFLDTEVSEFDGMAPRAILETLRGRERDLGPTCAESVGPRDWEEAQRRGLDRPPIPLRREDFDEED